MRLALWFILAAALPARTQSFVAAPTQVPTGPGNNVYTENVDFADVDLDGDFDALIANAKFLGNGKNKLWINQGGLQGGTLGFFVDETATQFTTQGDHSRDVDFGDLDGDGDPDALVTNFSISTNRTSRIVINQGGLQGGTAGFFVDESATRWVNIGINDGVTSFSSMLPSQALPGGGFISWSKDALLVDLDSDGDLDLVHSEDNLDPNNSFNGTPTRLFLNDGSGFFEEFNPSGFQLISFHSFEYAPGLWASGTQSSQTLASNGLEADIIVRGQGVEAGDLDGDFDPDLILNEFEDRSRAFRNELAGTELQRFVDVSGLAFGTGGGSDFKYEQELFDFDNDDDLDLYALGWASFSDALGANDGNMNFGAFVTMPSGFSQDVKVLDYDADGDLDVLGSSSHQNSKLLANQGAPTYGLADVTATELPSVAPGAGSDSVDVDLDGDQDVLVASSSQNVLLVNVTEIADTHPPRVVLEQVGPPACGEGPVAVRASVYDNASWEWMRYNTTVLEYTVDGGAQQVAPMSFSGGQLWRGEIPGGSAGAVAYRVRSTDPAGNAGVSPVKSVLIAPAAVSYCTTGTSASGCQAVLSASGTPSATAPSGFSLAAAGVEGQKDGMFFFGVNGRQGNAWGNGSSFQCVVPPVQRAGLLPASGSAGQCDGAFGQDLNALWSAQPGKNPGPGAVVQAQLWYRDPQNTSNQTTSLSDGLEFSVCP